MRPFSSVLIAALLAVASFCALADKIDINRADAVALTALHGIGQAKAEAIVEYRRTHGPFRSIEELAQVKGLGNAILERNRDRITIGEGAVPRQGIPAD